MLELIAQSIWRENRSVTGGMLAPQQARPPICSLLQTTASLREDQAHKSSAGLRKLDFHGPGSDIEATGCRSLPCLILVATHKMINTLGLPAPCLSGSPKTHLRGHLKQVHLSAIAIFHFALDEMLGEIAVPALTRIPRSHGKLGNFHFYYTTPPEIPRMPSGSLQKTRIKPGVPGRCPSDLSPIDSNFPKCCKRCLDAPSHKNA